MKESGSWGFHRASCLGAGYAQVVHRAWSTCVWARPSGATHEVHTQQALGWNGCSISLSHDSRFASLEELPTASRGARECDSWEPGKQAFVKVPLWNRPEQLSEGPGAQQHLLWKLRWTRANAEAGGQTAAGWAYSFATDWAFQIKKKKREKELCIHPEEESGHRHSQPAQRLPRQLQFL